MAPSLEEEIASSPVRLLARLSPLVNRIFSRRKGGISLAVVEPKIDGDLTHRAADSTAQKLCGNFQNAWPGMPTFPAS